MDALMERTLPDSIRSTEPLRTGAALSEDAQLAHMRDLAAKNKGAVVDFHGPMTAFNLKQQRQDPKYTIVGGDRVHPGAPGMLMMAWLFLKAQGVSPVVSN